MAVSSVDTDVDPVGACVGIKGNRVQNIVQELRGEKIDIVQWSPDIARFVCNALSPAEIARVIIDEDNQSMEVIVNDEYLSIAIGKGGQNVSLACEITGWHLEVTSEEDYSREVKAGYDNLMRLTGVGLSMAEVLFKAGYASLYDIVEAPVEDIAGLMGIQPEDAMLVIQEAGQILETDQLGSGEFEPDSAYDADPDHDDMKAMDSSRIGYQDEDVEPADPETAQDPAPDDGDQDTVAE